MDLATSIASSTPPDILALTETWLKEHDSDAILGLPDDYLIFRKDRPSRGGGILTAVKANLHPVHHAEFDSPELELLWVSLSCQRGRCLLCTLYRPPCATTSFWDYLNAVVSRMDHFLPKFDCIIFMGDFNIDCNPAVADSPNRSRLFELADSLNLFQLVTDITHPLVVMIPFLLGPLSTWSSVVLHITLYPLRLFPTLLPAIILPFSSSLV